MMSHLYYLAALLAGIGGLLLCDRRWRLAFWHDGRRTLRAIVPAVTIFVLWDFAGITGGIFAHGASQYSLPFTILPEFPLEELFFLFLLCYTTLLIYQGVQQWRRI